MATRDQKSNVFTVRLKPEMLTIIDRYAEDHTNGNRSAAANYFLELGLQQADLLPKPITADDISKMLDERLKEAEERINKFTDDTVGKQTAVVNQIVRDTVSDTIKPQLVATSEHLLQAGETQRDQISEQVSEELSKQIDEKLDAQLEKIVEQTKPKKGFWQRVFGD